MNKWTSSRSNKVIDSSGTLPRQRTPPRPPPGQQIKPHQNSLSQHRSPTNSAGCICLVHAESSAASRGQLQSGARGDNIVRYSTPVVVVSGQCTVTLISDPSSETEYHLRSQTSLLSCGVIINCPRQQTPPRWSDSAPLVGGFIQKSTATRVNVRYYCLQHGFFFRGCSTRGALYSARGVSRRWSHSVNQRRVFIGPAGVAGWVDLMVDKRTNNNNVATHSLTHSMGDKSCGRIASHVLYMTSCPQGLWLATTM